MIKSQIRRYGVRVVSALILLGLGVWFAFCLPSPLFPKDYSLVLLDNKNQLYHVAITKDEQYRFAAPDSIPLRLEQAVLTFEDRHFYQHFGVNPVSLFQAIEQGITGHGWRGGSTISMQVVRLATKKRGRNPIRKLGEIFQALRLELQYSKAEILQMYFTHAPYGRNLVGIQAASYCYFGTAIGSLSFAQCATLAVLPNAPGSIYVSKRHDKLISKRNRLLHKMHQTHLLNDEQLSRAIAEPLGSHIFRFPKRNAQLLQATREAGQTETVATNIVVSIQNEVENIFKNSGSLMQNNGIQNMAAIVIETQSGKVVSYMGNTPLEGTPQASVDMIQAKRSYGSLLKPFLYASALDKGLIMPQSWLSDAPGNWNGYSPHNFYNSYQGVVPADVALYNSLNLPFVNLLQQYGTHNFLLQCRALGLGSLKQEATHYGLSLILGGGECTLWELASAYQQMAYSLTNGKDLSSRKDSLPHWFHTSSNAPITSPERILSKEALYATVDALKMAHRPDMISSWTDYLNNRPIAWKTGTSFGQRDAWCIGITPNYTIGVWCGNADGKPANQLTGIKVAAPLLFQIYSGLSGTGWFQEPQSPKQDIALCAVSHERATKYCNATITAQLSTSWKNNASCQYHKAYMCNESGTERYLPACMPATKVVEKVALVLSPLQQWYYVKANPDYKGLPPLSLFCRQGTQENPLFVYPADGSTLTLAANGRFLAKAIASQGASEIAWYEDDVYIKTTTGQHQIALQSTKGHHKLAILDDMGNYAEIAVVVR